MYRLHPWQSAGIERLSGVPSVSPNWPWGTNEAVPWSAKIEPLPERVAFAIDMINYILDRTTVSTIADREVVERVLQWSWNELVVYGRAQKLKSPWATTMLGLGAIALILPAIFKSLGVSAPIAAAIVNSGALGTP